MKNLIFILMIVLASCAGTPQDKTYNIIYTDGTKETVTLKDELKFNESGDCIESCGCFSNEQFKRCGVRKFELVSVASTNTDSAPVANGEPKKADTVIVKVPTNLKHY